ncbi:MAG: metal ABC transporter permease [Lachnospiraceae bacterium]|nr:metal ABC transporter permease [Lachnospiraceae bacterium]MBP5254564.1 metal ABC transporter permease [Lachnospiraceae bacterium]
MIEQLVLYLQYPFVRYAVISAVFIAAAAALFGVTLVLKRFSFIGDGLSHVAFGAYAFAAVLSLTDRMLLVLPLTVVAAVLMLVGGRRKRLSGDASVAVFSVGALAFGYLILHIFKPSANLAGDVCSSLFGSASILTMTAAEVWVSVGLSVVISVLFVLFYHKIFAVTFDGDFARSSGISVERYHFFIAVVTAVIIVIAMKLVGSLLVSALIIFPALTAMRLFRSFRSVTVASVVTAVLSVLAGLLVSIVAGTPAGATIVAVQAAVFGIAALIGRFRG